MGFARDSRVCHRLPGPRTGSLSRAHRVFARILECRSAYRPSSVATTCGRSVVHLVDLVSATSCVDSRYGDHCSVAEIARGGVDVMPSSCVVCQNPGKSIHFWNSGEMERGTFGLCDSCENASKSCRVCGKAVDSVLCGTSRYRLVHETPFADRPHLWAFCSSTCENEEDVGHWASERCDGCDRDIPAYALDEGHTAQFVPYENGTARCLQCATSKA